MWYMINTEYLQYVTVTLYLNLNFYHTSWLILSRRAIWWNGKWGEEELDLQVTSLWVPAQNSSRRKHEATLLRPFDLYHPGRWFTQVHRAQGLFRRVLRHFVSWLRKAGGVRIYIAMPSTKSHSPLNLVFFIWGCYYCFSIEWVTNRQWPNLNSGPEFCVLRYKKERYSALFRLRTFSHQFQFITYTLLIVPRIADMLEPVPVVFGLMVEHTLNWLTTHCWAHARQTSIRAHNHTQGQFKACNEPTVQFFGEETGVPGQEPRRHGENMQMPRPAIEPHISALWDWCANRSSTVKWRNKRIQRTRLIFLQVFSSLKCALFFKWILDIHYCQENTILHDSRPASHYTASHLWWLCSCLSCMAHLAGVSKVWMGECM